MRFPYILLTSILQNGPPHLTLSSIHSQKTQNKATRSSYPSSYATYCEYFWPHLAPASIAFVLSGRK
jgi:hypothetical protein